MYFSSQGRLSKSFLCAIRKGFLGIEQTKSFVCLVEIVAVGCGGSGQMCSLYIARVVGVWESKTSCWSDFTVLQEKLNACCCAKLQAEVPCTLCRVFIFIFIFIYLFFFRVFPKAAEGEICPAASFIHCIAIHPQLLPVADARDDGRYPHYTQLQQSLK